jgi:hypothetical protein
LRQAVAPHLRLKQPLHHSWTTPPASLHVCAIRQGAALPTYSSDANPVVDSNCRKVMSFPGVRSLVCFVCVAFLFGSGPAAYAQGTGDAKADQQKAEAAKTEAAHIAEMERLLPGAPGRPECVHSGELTIANWMKFDMDTAARHMAVYDRFGCPGDYLRSSFRCMLRFGMPGPKDKDKDKDKEPPTLEQRVRDCWLKPDLAPTTAAAATTAPAVPATTAAPPAPAPAPAAPAGTGVH